MRSGQISPWSRHVRPPSSDRHIIGLKSLLPSFVWTTNVQTMLPSCAIAVLDPAATGGSGLIVELAFIPVDAVVRDGVAERLVASHNIPVVEGETPGVPALEEPVLFIVQEVELADAQPLPREIGPEHRVPLVLLELVDDAGETVHVLDDVVIDEELLTTVDCDRLCHLRHHLPLLFPVIDLM